MAINFNSNSPVHSANSTPSSSIAQPSSEFYSIFSQEEIGDIIQTLKSRREIPLKYSYKGRGAKNWNNFYLKYLIPRWYRMSNVEIDLLRDNFEYVNGSPQNCEKINVIDVGAGNSYPVKEFIDKLNQIGKVNRYTALDISEELLELSRKNFSKWFPSIQFTGYTIDIENMSIPKLFLVDQTTVEANKTANIFLHLGVTIGNHQNRNRVLKNFRDSMGKNDFLVFTNEIGFNSNWDGKVRGGFKYHVEQIYEWIRNNFGIKAEDCELVRKYDSKTDSMIANIKFCRKYTLNFSLAKINKTLELLAGEEVTIWRHHKYQIPEVIQEIEQAGLQIVHYNTNKYSSHIIVICKVANN